MCRIHFFVVVALHDSLVCAAAQLRRNIALDMLEENMRPECLDKSEYFQLHIRCVLNLFYL